MFVIVGLSWTCKITLPQLTRKLCVYRNGNRASIFTTCGVAARKFQDEVDAELVSEFVLLSSKNPNQFFSNFVILVLSNVSKN